jgi:hypothetical protein
VTHIQITITPEGRPGHARVLSLNTEMEAREAIQSLSVVQTILSHYAPPKKEPSK